MAQFKAAFDDLIDNWEDPGRTGKVTCDSGGLTKYGISQKGFPELDIRNLTIDIAANIYRNNYWFPLRCPEVISQTVANKILNMAVNMEPRGGKGAAIRIIQCACCDAGWPVNADGVMGPLTLNAVNQADETTLLDCIRSRAKDHYCKIAAANPDESKYLAGWLRRAEA